MATIKKPSVLLVLSVCFLYADFIYAQQPVAYPPENFYTIKASEQARLTALYSNDTTDNDDIDQFHLWVRQWEPMLFPHGDFLIAQKAGTNLYNYRQTHSQQFTSSFNANWTPLGPFDIPIGTNVRGKGVGRLHSITFDKPQNPTIMFTCSPTGGLWYSTDGGDNWLNGGTDFLPSASAAYCVADPNNNTNWFLATGDGEGWSGGSGGAEGSNPSFGIYRKMGTGSNWQLIGNAIDLGACCDASNGNSNWYGWQIKKILVDPNDGNNLYAATSFGIFKSTNALQSIVTWQKLVTSGGTISNDDPNNYYNHPFYDIEFKPGTNNIIYAAKDAIPGAGIRASIIMSTDAGATWSTITNGISNIQNFNRIALEVTLVNPNTAYAVFLTGNPYGSASCPACGTSIYKFDFNTLTWTLKNNSIPDASYRNEGMNINRAQAFAVSPTDENTIIVGNVSPLYISSNGGQNWNTLTVGTHDDIHHIVFLADGITLWVAADGGNYKSTTLGSTWQGKSSGLAVSTIDYGAGSETNPNIYSEGVFDNGTILFNGITWTNVNGGDGQSTMIDYTDANIMYASQQSYSSFHNIYREDNGGTSFSNSCGFNAGVGNGTFESITEMNFLNPKIIFAGDKDVWRTMNKGISGSWNKISDFSQPPYNFTSYRAWKIYSSPSNPDILYCHLIVGSVHRLFKTTFATSIPSTVISNWTEILLPLNSWISDIAIDNKNPEVFWLTYSGFNYVPSNFIDKKVWKYDGNITQWSNITEDIGTVVGSDISVSTIVQEKGSDDGLYVGCNAGVYYINKKLLAATVGTKWQAFNQGLPNVNHISNLEINYHANKIRAFTYGRGL